MCIALEYQEQKVSCTSVPSTVLKSLVLKVIIKKRKKTTKWGIEQQPVGNESVLNVLQMSVFLADVFRLAINKLREQSPLSSLDKI